MAKVHATALRQVTQNANACPSLRVESRSILIALLFICQIMRPQIKRLCGSWKHAFPETLTHLFLVASRFDRSIVPIFQFLIVCFHLITVIVG